MHKVYKILDPKDHEVTKILPMVPREYRLHRLAISKSYQIKMSFIKCMKFSYLRVDIGSEGTRTSLGTSNDHSFRASSQT